MNPVCGLGLMAGMLLAGPMAAGAQAPGNAPSEPAPYHATVSAYRLPFDRMGPWRIQNRIDFGSKTRLYPKATVLDGEDWVPYAAWRGMVRAVDRAGHADVYTGDFLEGEDATLILPAQPLTRYRVVLTLGDAEAARGPITISVYGEPIVQGLRTEAGRFTDVQFEAAAMGKRINVRITADSCRTFAVCGASIFVEANDVKRARLAPPAPDDSVLPPARPAGTGVAGAREALDACAAFLLRTQPVEGGFSYHGAWYECGFSVRALLAAARTLGRDDYREAALACLDRFVAEQHAGGGWGARYFGSPECELARETREAAASRNLADVGSMALALSVAAAGETGPRRDRYRQAAEAYADSLVLPAQMESGAFPNLLYQGVEFRHPYTVATATQASSLSALYAITGEERYRDAARRAGLFLAERVRDDGTMEFCPHDTAGTKILGPERMGDLFYPVEALLWVHRVGDPETRTAVAAALDRFFRAPATREALLAPDPWFLRTGAWELSKRAGLLYLLADYRARVAPAPELDPFVERLAALLEDPRTCPLMGVLAEPDVPRSDYAQVATGFAGLGLQALLDPDVLFPEPR